MKYSDLLIKKALFYNIKNYQEFNNKILLQIKRSNLRFYKNKILQESFCLNSSNVTKNLFQTLKNLN